MKEYQGFPISNFRTGFDEALEPWLLPRDAFQSMKNAHLYRGVLERIPGYDLYARMSYRNMIALTGTIDGVNKTFTGTLSPIPTTNNFYAYSSTSSTGSSAETFSYLSDASSTVVNLVGSNGGTGTVNISTGAVSITFGTTAPQKIPGGGNVYNSVIFAWDGAPDAARPIMGIKPYFQSSGAQDILVFDTRRVGKVISLSGTMLLTQNVDNGITELPHQYYASSVFVGDGVTTTFTGNVGTTLIQPATVTFSQVTSVGVPVTTLSDSGTGNITGINVTASSSFINYATGAFTITFTAAPANGNVFNSSVGVYGNIFTGNFTNFISLANYQSNAFFTNDKDPPMYWNGTIVQYLNTNLSVKLITGSLGIPQYDITVVLLMVVNRERLILLNVVVNGVQAVNYAYWSTALAPTNFTNNENLPAPTSEPIRTQSIINSDLIVRFANSERVLRYTNDAFSPFRWDSTNVLWRCDAPYSAINYDSFFTSVGRPAIVGSDGVNVTRADEIIPDFTFNTRIDEDIPIISIDQASIAQCYGERFDDFKEGWLCFKNYLTGTGSALPSDNVLSFNYLDGTYAVYSFPFSCLGFGRIITQQTWGTSIETWESAFDTWGTFYEEQSSLVDLAGDQFSNVFLLGNSNLSGQFKSLAITGITNADPGVVTSAAHGLQNGQSIIITGVVGMTGLINNQTFTVTGATTNTFQLLSTLGSNVDTTNTTAYGVYASGGIWTLANPILMDVISKNFNPFIEEGELARFGYLDLLVSANANTNIRVQFFKDDQLYIDNLGNPNGYYQETTLTFSPSTPNSSVNQSKVWKRIYVGAVGKEHTIRIYQNILDFTTTTLGQPCRIHALVPYFKSAGRIFN